MLSALSLSVLQLQLLLLTSRVIGLTTIPCRWSIFGSADLNSLTSTMTVGGPLFFSDAPLLPPPRRDALLLLTLPSPPPPLADASPGSRGTGGASSHSSVMTWGVVEWWEGSGGW